MRMILKHKFLFFSVRQTMNSALYKNSMKKLQKITFKFFQTRSVAKNLLKLPSKNKMTFFLKMKMKFS
jgi:hypothetical protein